MVAGMHGAALAWSLLMPPGTALLELWPQPGLWRLYEHTAEWAGLVYRRVHCILCILPLTAVLEATAWYCMTSGGQRRRLDVHCNEHASK